MSEIETITRKWGNSLGITFPKKVVEEQKLHENQKLMIEIRQVIDFKKLKGLVRFKKSAQQLKDEMRSGWK